MKRPHGGPATRSNAPLPIALAIALGCIAIPAAGQVSQSGEKKDMRRVGHVDLQGRSAYQPNTIVYPDGRTIAFAGTHSGTAPNPLNGGVAEPNGTMIVDVTDPARPVETFHIAGPGGNSQMVRPCPGSDLPQGVAGKVYLMRNFNTGYEIYDVTDVRAPVLLSRLPGVRSTHKMWWECTSGIAYLPGSFSYSVGSRARAAPPTPRCTGRSARTTRSRHATGCTWHGASAMTA